jgi:hypothetical protein
MLTVLLTSEAAAGPGRQPARGVSNPFTCLQVCEVCGYTSDRFVSHRQLNLPFQIPAAVLECCSGAALG